MKIMYVLILFSSLLLNACGASCEPPEGYESQGDQYRMVMIIDRGQGPVEETVYEITVNDEGSAVINSPQQGAGVGEVTPGRSFFLEIENQGRIWHVDLYIDCEGGLWLDPSDYVPPWEST